MAAEDRLTPEALRELLDYDLGTGSLTWRQRLPAADHRAWNARYQGKEALTGVDGHGYRHGTILGRWYKAHRVVWALHYGIWPEHEVSPSDGDRWDLRISNLTDAPHSTHHKNTRRSRRNTSGATGVSWSKTHQKWQASIRADGKNRPLGKYSSFEDAVAARRNAEREAGYNERHGEVRTTPDRYVPTRYRL